MSLVFLSFIIQSALVSAMGIFDFEEKVLANNMTPRLSDDMSHPLAAPKQETTTEWQSAIPTENADPMSAIMAADYARENAHLSQPGLNISKTEDAKAPSVPASTENADPMAAIMAADYARENAHLPQPGLNIRKSEDAKAPSALASTESADPMAAIMAADYASEKPDLPQPGLTIHKNEDAKTASTQSSNEDADPMAAIMAADYARENTHLPQPGLNIDKNEDEKTPSVPASTKDADPMADIMAADYARENAHLPQPDLKIGKTEDSKTSIVQASAPAMTETASTPSGTSQDGRLTVKQSLLALIGWKKSPKQSSGNAPKEIIGTFGQVTHEAPLPAEEVEAKKPQTTVAMADRPLGISSRKYRNQGAAMYHVEPTPRKATTPEQDALLKQKAILEAVAKHRARREEVENVFHISQEGQSNEANNEVSTEAAPIGILRTLTRFIFLLAGLCSIASLTYHKYEVIVKMYEGKQGDHKFKLPKFKVKQDDDYGSAQLPRFSPQVSTGSQMSSVVGSFRQGLSRRGAIDTTSSYGFGV